jgi:light-regulated signal transduction histidine kinase (bacteriophytochrome)
MNPQEKDVDSFIHSLSHDLKNILHNIHAYAELLEDENDPEFIKGIIRLVKKAREILNDYVTLADKGDFSQRP